MAPPLKTYPEICFISDPFKGLLLDASGVFWEGGAVGLRKGAKECMEKLLSQGKIIGILTNSTQLSSKQLDTFHRHGLVLGKHFHFILTSGDAVRNLFLQQKLPFPTPSRKFFLFGEPHPKFHSHEAIFQGTVYEETSDILQADFIYISIPHLKGEDQTNPEVFREYLKKIQPKNLPMICPNPDLFCMEGSPQRAVVRQGSIAKMYEEMGGKVYYQGKPDRSIYEKVLYLFNQYSIALPSEILMIGDTPETDIRGANRMKIPTALILKTGIMGERISQGGMQKTVEGLSGHDSPTFFIERFANDL